MNDREKLEYLQKYKVDKENGEPFFPDAIFKDAIVALVIFIALGALALFVGAELKEIANPSDDTFTPRPEWYFLFLFQLLKYFPGNLEVIGVIILPVLAIIFLALLPWTDRSHFRHWSKRPVVTAITLFLLAGGIGLTVMSMVEAPPPAEAADTGGDATAALYAANCAACHGESVTVQPGVDLFAVIQAGNHEGMPAWNSDLSPSEIDALVGFILAPTGSRVFSDACGACHDTAGLIAVAPGDLRSALDLGPDFPAHAGLDIPQWSETLSQAQQTELLNFLTAPDGKRLYTRECSACHGKALAFTGSPDELRKIITEGGLHLQMPAFGGRLPQADVETLAAYVVNPSAVPEGPALFSQYCASCHHERVPQADSFNTAVATITSGSAHQTMPVWGEVLTQEQLDALVTYIIDQASGSATARGEELFAQNCTACHGALGEGGPNPTRAGDIIAPISTAEYLQTRDDATLRAIISQGQPDFGMSPFGTAFGGPLSEADVDAIVAYIRSWEAAPPVVTPPEVPGGGTSTGSLRGDELYAGLCAQCHAVDGGGVAGLGPSLIDAAFQSATDQQIFDDINLGHPASAMIAWGEILTSSQIDQLVTYIRTLGGGETTAGPPTFDADVRPIFQRACDACHGTFGGWNGTGYDSAINSGDNGPVVVPGDVAGSLLAQRVQGIGGIMPPSGGLPDADVQVILDWIAAGAPQR